jgi:hypothetical protein
MGYVEYRCLHCGQGKHLVSMSCKSSLCLRCAKVYVDNWVSQVSKVLHEGVIYRHIILTVPAMFKRLLLRFERIQQRHYGMKLLAYTLINLRKFCGT